MTDVTPEALELALSRMHVTVGSPVLCDPAPDAPEGSAQGIPLYPASLARMLLADIAGQPGGEAGAAHDHSWAEDMDEVRAVCPDFNPLLAGTGICCPGEPDGEAGTS